MMLKKIIIPIILLFPFLIFNLSCHSQEEHDYDIVFVNGLIIDDITLKSYQETLDESSDNIRFLSPLKTGNGHEVSFGWIQAKNSDFDIPNRNTLWTLTGNNNVLDLNNSLIFEWKNDTGQIFQSTISIDDEYLFEITQKIINNGTNSIIVNNAAKINDK